MKSDLLGDISNGVWLGLGVASVWVFAAVACGVLYHYFPDNLKMWFGPRTLLVVFGVLVFASYVAYSKVKKMLAGSSFAIEKYSNEKV